MLTLKHQKYKTDAFGKLIVILTWTQRSDVVIDKWVEVKMFLTLVFGCSHSHLTRYVMFAVHGRQWDECQWSFSLLLHSSIVFIKPTSLYKLSRGQGFELWGEAQLTVGLCQSSGSSSDVRLCRIRCSSLYFLPFSSLSRFLPPSFPSSPPSLCPLFTRLLILFQGLFP